MAEGRSSFLPVPELAVAPPPPVPEGLDGVLGRATDEVHAEAEFRPVVDLLLGDVVIVEDLDAAARIRDPTPGFTPVTLDGEVLAPMAPSPAVSARARRWARCRRSARSAELAGEVARVEERYNEMLTRHYTLQKQMGHTEGVLKGLRKNQHAEELSLASQEKDLHKASEDLPGVRERLRRWRARRGSSAESPRRATRGGDQPGRGGPRPGGPRGARGARAPATPGSWSRSPARGRRRPAGADGPRVKVAAGSERGEAARKELESQVAQRPGDGGAHEPPPGPPRGPRRRAWRAELAGAGAPPPRSGRAEAPPRRPGTRPLGGAPHGAHQGHGARCASRTPPPRAARTGWTSSPGLSQITLREREIALELEHLVRRHRRAAPGGAADELHHYHLLPRCAAEAEQR